MKKCLVAICISFVLAASAAVADGILSGYVRTSGGQPVPYDQVTWGEYCGPVMGHAFTNASGYWSSDSSITHSVVIGIEAHERARASQTSSCSNL